MRTIPVLLVFTAMTHGSRAEPTIRDFADTFCVSCHDADTKKGNLDLTAALAADPDNHPEVWEKVVRRLRGRSMPPAGRTRPDEAAYATVLADLETSLDRAAADHPNPGRTSTLRRLTRTEYQNAVRDLLAVEIDAASLLPADEAGHGFDNVNVGTFSPTLLERYISAAQKISRLAIGGPAAGGDTIRVKPDITQEDRQDGLPFGTRGGAVVRYTFPRSGEYDLRFRLTRDRNELVEGLRQPHEMEVLLDRERVKLFAIEPPKGRGHDHVDAHLQLRLNVTAGPHDLGVTFLKTPSDVPETLRQPYLSRINMHRSPRLAPALFQVSIAGPLEDRGPGDTPSRRKVFVTRPSSPDDEERAARTILSTVMRRAYRRPVADEDLNRVMPFVQSAADFEAGIESALSAILVSREFLFRVEHDPPGLPPKTAYPVSDLDLASRLSFFLWSSLPDEELLAAATQGELRQPAKLAEQAKRMLADPRSRSLATNFVGQWLHLRNLEAFTPDGRLFPDFDDNLRQAFRRETELLFEEIVQEDKSLLELLRTNHAWLNERLAKHYGIPHVYGPHFRKVTLDADSRRGGLLRHGSIQTVTSYATRTSPVIRGKWVLETLLGTPPPPPPPDVPALDDNNVSASLPVRERLAQHRANAACASCHNLIDPVGFALENYDAIGRWRIMEEGRPVDADGGLPDGSRFTGVAELEANLLKRPELFAGTLTEKLLTFALGRGIETSDGPAVREIVRSASANNYRMSALVEAIVTSPPFRMRTSP